MNQELTTNREKIIDPEILRSIKKSRLREEILLFLFDIKPQYSYLSEIARNVRSDPSNVLGCIKGMSKRYSESRSLMELNLVGVVEKDGKSYYGITDKGVSVAKYIKNSYRA
ncbi:hypothetical protein C9439_00350 [archaeon SCG-AAA382B04]|nr:hypothetical protein C9439_00350 [archaeon SCG-AAA382B04]